LREAIEMPEDKSTAPRQRPGPWFDRGQRARKI
jgi:hypothetical protein